MKNVFVTMPFPGVRRVGEEGAKLGLWELLVLEGGRVPIPPADLYVLGSWHLQYVHVLSALPTRARVGVCWTSSAAEMELNAWVERDYLAGLLQDPRISFIWFGDPGLAQVYPEKGFAYTYPLQFNPQPPQPKADILTLLCPDKPSKNIFAQLLAVSIIQKHRPELVLHTNIQDLRGLGDRLKVVQHGWLPRPEYHALLASARLNLAASFSETMCYQGAEAVMLGTPCLLSDAVPWTGSPADNPFTSTLLDAEQLAEDILMHLQGTEYVLEQQLENVRLYSSNFHREEWESLCLDAAQRQHL